MTCLKVYVPEKFESVMGMPLILNSQHTRHVSSEWHWPLACAGRPPDSSIILQDPKSAAGSRAQTGRLPHQN